MLHVTNILGITYIHICIRSMRVYKNKELRDGKKYIN